MAGIAIQLLLSGVIIAVAALSPLFTGLRLIASGCNQVLENVKELRSRCRGKLTAVITDNLSASCIGWASEQLSSKDGDFLHIIVLDPIIEEQHFDSDTYWKIGLGRNIVESCESLRKKGDQFDGQVVLDVQGVDCSEMLRENLEDINPDFVVIGSSGPKMEKLSSEFAVICPYNITVAKY